MVDKDKVNDNGTGYLGRTQYSRWLILDRQAPQGTRQASYCLLLKTGGKYGFHLIGGKRALLLC